jgi:hypothetical protein
MRYPISFLFVFCFSQAFSQPWYDAKRNYQWITGYQYDNIVYDEAIDNVIYDFTGDTMQIHYVEKFPSSETRGTNGSICDENGQLLLYSTGCRVHEADGTIIPGTDTMNAGFVYNAQCYDYMGNPNSGYTVPSGLIFLPVGKERFFIFYLWKDYKPDYGPNNFRLYSMMLDKSPGDVHFNASQVNHIILSDTLNGSLAACRHANGRDWWLLCPKTNSPKIFTFLVDSSGAKLQLNQKIGASRLSPYDEATGQCAFSPDGTKFIEYCIRSDIKIFDFDRCSGRLSNPIHIPIKDYADTIFSAGACVSPNARYLYVPSSNHIYQFDLKSNDISTSKQVVAVYDGVKMGFLTLDFNHAELAPDGKIYITNWAGRTTYHVIEHPDSAGVACGVRQHVQWTKWAVSNIPHHPNYLLGPLAGSGCDTITFVKQVHRKNEIKIFPNPVSGMMIVEIMKDGDGFGQACEISVLNQVGQIIEQQYVPPYTPLFKMDTGTWKKGLYFVYLINMKNQVLATGRIVKIE